MITVVSSDARERHALTALCETRQWLVNTCDSARAFRRSLAKATPKVVLARHKLSDGYSDDILTTLRTSPTHDTRVIVLASAGTTSAQEARQLTLGADCVLRDPVRPEVLLEYIAKYRATHSGAAPASATHRRRPTRDKPLQLAGALLSPLDRRLQKGNRVAQLTPREVALARQLIAARGEILSYDELYESILGRRFRGDTSNMRVLLGKLSASAASVGVSLRDWVQVIPKTGYRYATPRLRALKSRRAEPSATHVAL